MTNFLFQGIRSLDFFGVKPKFTIDNSSKYKTVVGGFISLIVSILILAGFIHFGAELWQKANPSVTTSSIFQQDPDNFELKPDNFNFFIGVQDSNANYFIDPTVLQVSINYGHYYNEYYNDGSVNWVSVNKNLNAQPCNLNYSFPYFKDEFESQPLDQLYCMDPALFQNISLGGNWGEETFDYITMSVNICSNSTDSDIVCKTPEEITKIVAGGFFVVNFIDNLFQPNIYGDPKKSFRRNTYTTMSNQYFKEVNFYFKNVEYNTDRGTLMEDIETQNYLQLDYEKELYDFRSLTTGTILSCVFRMSNKKDIYHRKYIKIQDVLAQVGGLVKALLVIVQLMYANFSKVGYYFYLWENMFEINNNTYDSDRSSMDQNNLFIYKNNKLNNSSISNPIINLNKTQKITEAMVERKFDKKKTSFSECVKKGLCFCLIEVQRNKNKSFNKLYKYIELKSDFRRVLLFHEKFDVMKEILLTGDQMNIFDYHTHKIDLNKQEVENVDHTSVVKSYQAISTIKQNKVGERLKTLFEKKLL